MRNPTKVALKHLAETMVENGSYINLRGTGDFINEAVRLHKKTGSFVTVDTIRRHQKELEQMCQDEMLKRQPLKKDIIIPKQFDDDVEDDCEDDADIALYDEMGFQVDDSMIISIAMAKIERMISMPKPGEVDDDSFFNKRVLKEAQEELLEIEKQQSLKQQIGNLVVKSITPNYSMFGVGEDGLRVLRGEYKNLYVHEIDAQRWAGCAIGWSRYQLKQNEQLGANRPGALTEDDKNVFLDIISGKDV